MGWDFRNSNALVNAVTPTDLDTHTVRSEPEAMLLEGKLIKEFLPRYNISFRDDKRFLLIKINLNDPIPRFMLTRLRQDDGARYFGPFAHAASARHTLTLARRKFNLRGCRPLTAQAQKITNIAVYGHLKYLHRARASAMRHARGLSAQTKVLAACEIFSPAKRMKWKASLKGQMKKGGPAAEDFEKSRPISRRPASTCAAPRKKPVYNI